MSPSLAFHSQPQRIDRTEGRRRSSDSVAAAAQMSPWTISSELRLVIECCRWPAGPERQVRLAAAVADVADWGRFTGLTEAQRVEGLVANALVSASGVPDGVIQWCRHAAAEVRARSL